MRLGYAVVAIAGSILFGCDRVPVSGQCERDPFFTEQPELPLVEVHPGEPQAWTTLGVSCGVTAPPGATVTLFAGDRLLDRRVAENGEIEFRERLREIPAAIGALTVRATASGKRSGSATLPIPFSRFGISQTESDDGLTLHVDVCPGCTFSWDGAPLASRDITYRYETLLLDETGPFPNPFGFRVPISLTGPAGTIEGAALVELPGSFGRKRRDFVEALSTPGTPQPWAAAWERDGGPRPRLDVILDPPKDLERTVPLRTVELLLYRTIGVIEIERCGPYSTGDSLTFVWRQRDLQTLELVEARTGKSLGKKQFKGGMPRGCDTRESVMTLNGAALGARIEGAPASEAEIAAWIDTISSSAPR